MKIGFLLDTYKPHVSGVTIFVALNKKMFEAAGHEVFVFTFGNLDYQDTEMNVIRSPGFPIIVNFYNINFRYTRQASRILQNMDIVHVQHPFISGWMALLYCKPKGIPIVYTNHTRYDLYSKVYVPLIPNIMGKWIMKWYLPTFARQVDLFMTPSAGMQNFLSRSGVSTLIDVVPNGIDLTPYQQAIEPIDRGALGFTEQDVLSIFVGRLGEEKNISFLLEAFSKFQSSFHPAGLILVGEGPQHANLVTMVAQYGLQDRVRFTGLVPYSDIPRYLTMADVFVTASISEVHPFTIIEAMAAGLPAVGIDSPGVSDIIIDGQNGCLCPLEEQAAYVECLLRLANDAPARLAMGRRAKECSEQYDLRRTSQMLLDRYQTVIEQAAGRKRKGFHPQVGDRNR